MPQLHSARLFLWLDSDTMIWTMDYGMYRTQDCVWIVTRVKLVVICVSILQSVPLIY